MVAVLGTCTERYKFEDSGRSCGRVRHVGAPSVPREWRCARGKKVWVCRSVNEWSELISVCNRVGRIIESGKTLDADGDDHGDGGAESAGGRDSSEVAGVSTAERERRVG